MKNLQRLLTIIAAGMLLTVAAASLPAQGAETSRAAEAARLIAVLRSGAATFDKARACQQLAVLGSKEAVPALAELLGDEKLAAYARCGLESIADPSADDALRAALGRLHGKLLAGVVNSIGVRRDAKAVSALEPIALGASSGAAAEALTALGRIATPDAIGILRPALKSESAAVRAAAADAILIAAERQLAVGHREEAAAIYEAVRAAFVPKPARLAATRGAIVIQGRPLLAEQLKSDDGAMFAMAVGASRLLPDRDVTQLLLAALGTAPPARQVLESARWEDVATQPCFPPCRRPRQVVPPRFVSRRFAPWASWPIRRACRYCLRPLRPVTRKRAPRPWPRRHKPVWQSWPAQALMPPSPPSWTAPTRRRGLPCWTSSRGGGSSRPRPRP